eukprot:TRINITY_DN91581_c0_g1_i1.p1 TRINITY_DN91581_c0_g1~~TRINITY_DN91581_c0_g1_i1.p1  ORF type:complete len:321 (-),score=8.55 TRINITY_DN91581_c0_g1_i1:164-1126(-)
MAEDSSVMAQISARQANGELLTTVTVAPSIIVERLLGEIALSSGCCHEADDTGSCRIALTAVFEDAPLNIFRSLADNGIGAGEHEVTILKDVDEGHAVRVDESVALVVSAHRLKFLFRASELREGGFRPEHLRAAGCGLIELAGAGFNISDFQADGFSAAEMLAAGVPATELAKIGCSAYWLRQAGCTYSSLLQCGFTPMRLLTVALCSERLIPTIVAVWLYHKRRWSRSFKKMMECGGLYVWAVLCRLQNELQRVVANRTNGMSMSVRASGRDHLYHRPGSVEAEDLADSWIDAFVRYLLFMGSSRGLRTRENLYGCLH